MLSRRRRVETIAQYENRTGTRRKVATNGTLCESNALSTLSTFSMEGDGTLEIYEYRATKGRIKESSTTSTRRDHLHRQKGTCPLSLKGEKVSTRTVSTNFGLTVKRCPQAKPVRWEVVADVEKSKNRLRIKSCFHCIGSLRVGDTQETHTNPGMSLAEEQRLWKEANERDRRHHCENRQNEKCPQVDQFEVVLVNPTFNLAGGANYVEMDGIGMVFEPAMNGSRTVSLPRWSTLKPRALSDTYALHVAETMCSLNGIGMAVESLPTSAIVDKDLSTRTRTDVPRFNAEDGFVSMKSGPISGIPRLDNSVQLHEDEMRQSSNSIQKVCQSTTPTSYQTQTVDHSNVHSSFGKTDFVNRPVIKVTGADQTIVESQRSASPSELSFPLYRMNLVTTTFPVRIPSELDRISRLREYYDRLMSSEVNGSCESLQAAAFDATIRQYCESPVSRNVTTKLAENIDPLIVSVVSTGQDSSSPIRVCDRSSFDVGTKMWYERLSRPHGCDEILHDVPVGRNSKSNIRLYNDPPIPIRMDGSLVGRRLYPTDLQFDSISKDEPSFW